MPGRASCFYTEQQMSIPEFWTDMQNMVRSGPAENKKRENVYTIVKTRSKK